MQLEDLKKFNIPNSPGVYFFLEGKEILYIGKATTTSSRVRSYFSKNLHEMRGPLLVEMMSRANKIEWQTTDSVLEALILEAALIKKFKPKYNTREKSDKSFNYVCITKEEIPKILVVRGRNLEAVKNFGNLALGDTGQGTRVSKNSLPPLAAEFGPFTNTSQLYEAMKIIRRIFPYIDASSSKKANYEFYRQIGLTPDLSPEKNALKNYLQNIKYITLFFAGKKKDILRGLKKDMLAAAKLKEFERAGELKRQLFAIQHINDVALLKHENMEMRKTIGFRLEAYDIAHMSGKNMVGVMTVIENGEVSKNEYKKFKIRTQDGANDTGALKEVLERRMRHHEWPYPSLIVVDGSTAQINAAQAVLDSMDLKIPIVSVLKDERHKPKSIEGDQNCAAKYKKEILLANSEAHRFAIAYHKNMRGRNFLNIKKKK